jgi:hypothetical protein
MKAEAKTQARASSRFELLRQTLERSKVTLIGSVASSCVSFIV